MSCKIVFAITSGLYDGKYYRSTPSPSPVPTPYAFLMVCRWNNKSPFKRVGFFHLWRRAKKERPQILSEDAPLS